MKFDVFHRRLVACVIVMYGPYVLSENIGNILKGIQSEFNIKTVPAVTTDNASNMQVAARETNYPNVGCFSHTLQLAINDSFKLPWINSVIINARRLVTIFSKSVLAAQALEDHQKCLGKDVKHLIGDVSTWWNSTYFMLSRLHELFILLYMVTLNLKKEFVTQR